MYTTYYQVATQAKFLEYGIDVTQPEVMPSGCVQCARQLLQEDREYTVAEGLSRNFKVIKSMYIRHLEYANGHMAGMWGDADMQPLSQAEVSIITANEPSEEV